MKIKPLFENVLVKIEKAPEKTKSGLILSPKEDNKLEEAIVLSVSDQVEQIREGDTVIFKSYNLDTVDIRGETCNFIKESDIIAVL